MDINVDVKEIPGKNGVRVVDLNGEIDVYTSPRVKETIGELIDQGHYDLIIRPSASLMSELSMAGSPLFAEPPVQLITSPGLTVACVQP